MLAIDQILHAAEEEFLNQGVFLHRNTQTGISDDCGYIEKAVYIDIGVSVMIQLPAVTIVLSKRKICHQAIIVAGFIVDG